MPSIEKTVTVEGGHYRDRATGAKVLAVRWNKDGDHPAVQRYPIDGRAIKGLIEISPKEKYNLRFGDWVIEDGDQVYVIEAEKFAARFVDIATEQGATK